LYLKHIELNGFKSFNNKKEFIIKNGITGIVGPNGSGKSNVADAIRWVLGEQSSKNLRGTHMEDVIFNGSQELAKKGYCEVALVFDNSDMRIPCEYTEISIRRKMYRSGESEYSINNTSCRLKDIIDLFRDTGIGKEGYSIIGQGKIDEILSSKAVSRRKVFEEAAGIMKYRVRKEEAERNLEKTHDNILRLDDIISELESQVEPLKNQMEEAKRYMALRDRLKHLEVNLYLYNQEKSAERIEKLQMQLSENEQEQKENAEATESLSARISACKAEYQELQGNIDEHNRLIADYGSSQEKLRGEMNVLNEREKNLKQRLEEISAQNVDADKSIELKTAKVEELDGQTQELNVLIDAKFEAINALRDKCAQMADGAGSVSERYAQLKVKAEKLRAEIETARREIGEKNVLLDLLAQKKEETQAELSLVQDGLQEVSQQKKEKEDELAAGKAENAKLLSDSNGLTLTINGLQEEYAKVEAELGENRQQLNQNISNQNLLSEIKDGYEGYQASVKALFGAARDNQAIKKKLIGTFAELVDVPQKYETAIEAVLGNALQNVIVQDEEDAKDVIDFLRKNRLGRVTFLPLDALKVKYLNEDEKDGFGNLVLSVASEVTGCADHVRPAIDFLLARTVIVEDMESAIALMRKTGYSFRTVTLKGDIIRPGGIITGGSMESVQTGLLSRNRMIGELGIKIKAAKLRVEKLTKQSGDIARRIEEKQKEREGILNGLRDREIAHTRAAQQLAGLEEQVRNAETRQAELEKQAALTEEQIGESAGFAENKNETLAGLQKEYDVVLEDIALIEESMNRDSEELAALRDNLAKEEIAQNELVSKKNMLLNELSHIRGDILEANDQIRQSQTQAEALEKELNTVVLAKKREIETSLNDMVMQLKNASTAAQEKYARREELLQTQKDLESGLEVAMLNKNDLIEQKYKIIANIEKIELIKENLQNKIWDDYGLTYANAQKLKGEFSYQNGTREIDEIKEEIAAMGAVNPNAIEDYARVSERLNHLLLQKNDLVKAGEDLKIVIQSLLGDMKSCFLEKFELINKNFQQVFQQLFGGGHAEVLLESESGDDVMECGIEIIAEPPGKKLQNLNLLSGGEKALTAIALLFAMLDINPSPVCLLDEIDAPLDEANVVRFSEYLKVLSVGLQFIVITHRKPTMAACDTLYGIAMHQKGVSEVVSVSLN
jgi:chromosome segregation protein